MLKLIGAIFIILSCTGAGMIFANRYSNRVWELRQLQKALVYIETEIMYGDTPLTVIVKELSQNEHGPLSALFTEVSNLMKQNENRTFIEYWQEAIRKHWSKTSLKESDRQIWVNLISSLGLSDRYNQQRHIQLALIHLQKQEEEAIEEQKKYEKLSRTLGLLTGALIVILIY